ncbi:MAG TPA: hypothetical protein VHM25_09585 [Polyangiaceae bacterium]|nr:hypothetical protein [Polyangiaceae bacterium]
MRHRAAAAAIGLAAVFSAASSFAQSAAPVQLRWQAPPDCPQEQQVRQKLRDLLGANADAAASRLRAEGVIEPSGEHFRLTLNIHYDLVNGKRVVQANSCEDLGGTAAVILAILFRVEHSSDAPLTARDLGGIPTGALADARSSGSETQASESDKPVAGSENAAAATDKQPPQKLDAVEKREPNETATSSETREDAARRWRFVLSVPELRTDIGVLPDAGYGIGLGAGARHDAWRFMISGAIWLAQDDEAGPFLGYAAHFGRVSAELSACHGFRFGSFELAPCLLFTVDDVSARATGPGISSTNPRTAWLSVGAGLQGLWSLGRHAALVFGVNGRVATSRPRFVSDGVGEFSQVGPAALGVLLGCEWQF